MQKHEFLEVCEAAIRAAKSAEVWRCIDAINCLKKAPQTLVVDVLQKSSIGSRFCKVLVEHKNPRIQAEATVLRDLWLMHFYTTGRSKNTEIQVKKKTGDSTVKKMSTSSVSIMKKTGDSTMKKMSTSSVSMMKKTGDLNLVKKMSPISDSKTGDSTMKKMSTSSDSTGDSARDKLREILETSLSKVASEVVTIEMKKRVASCDPRAVAASVESAMFERLGCFAGPLKARCRSILYNMGDSNNPDLRRKVLIGEINGEKLATMDTTEMGSDEIRKQLEEIKEKARLREDNRIKFQSHMLMI